jgi:hypothetical protein
MKFNTKIDMTTVAIEVLTGSVILGIIAGLLVTGFSPTNIGSSLANLLAAVGLAALLTAAIALTLGMLIYLGSRLLRLIGGRRAHDGTHARPPGDGSATSDVGIAAAMSASDL